MGRTNFAQKHQRPRQHDSPLHGMSERDSNAYRPERLRRIARRFPLPVEYLTRIVWRSLTYYYINLK